MGDITKEDLKSVVFVTAHNTCQLTDQVRLDIDSFDVETYRRYLGVALEQRKRADETDGIGGGSRDASFLQEAIANLEQILSQ